jgi:hypothetical protein
MICALRNRRASQPTRVPGRVVIDEERKPRNDVRWQVKGGTLEISDKAYRLCLLACRSAVGPHVSAYGTCQSSKF